MSYVFVSSSIPISDFRLFVDESKLTEDVRHHLELDETTSPDDVTLTILAYNAAHDELKRLVGELPGKVWVRRKLIDWLRIKLF